MMARGFSVGAVISRTFSVWWSNLFRFGLLGLLTFVPMLVGIGGMAVAMSRRVPGRAVAPEPMVAVLGAGGYLLSMFFMVVEMGALTLGAVDAIAGRKPRIGTMLRVGLRRAGPLFLAGLLLWLLIMAGMLLLVVPGIILGCATAVAIPACVAEGKGPIASLRRSFALTRGHRFELFAAFLVVLLATSMVNMFAQVVLTLVTATLAPRFAPLLMLPLVAMYAFMYTLPIMLPAVAYHDLRVAKEGVVTADLLKVFE
jgi:hypothetical protein